MIVMKRPELAQSETVAELPVACSDEKAAVEFFERKRWGKTPCCPCCGDTDVYQMKDRKTGERNKDFRWRCRGCGKLYSVRLGMVMEESLLPMRVWARAIWEASVSKNGISALELSRKAQISYKSALFVMNRLRFAMKMGTNPPKLTGTIEADELYWGGKARHGRIIRGVRRKGPNPDKPKTPIFAVVQRGGDVRASVMPSVTSGNVREAMLAMADPSCRLVTDELKAYRRIGRPFSRHDRVNHTRREYVNKNDPEIHTNTIESFFARVRRGLTGTYHAVSPEHLHRYVTQYEWLYNARGMNDGERIEHLIRSADGKRLRYRQPPAKSA